MCFITLSLLLLLMSCLPYLCCCKLSTFISSFCSLSFISILGVLFPGYLQPERYRQSRFFYFVITQNTSPLVSFKKCYRHTQKLSSKLSLFITTYSEETHVSTRPIVIACCSFIIWQQAVINPHAINAPYCLTSWLMVL